MEELRTGYRVCDVMTRKPISVKPEMTVTSCAKLMAEKGIGSLVVKEGDVLRGYIAADIIVNAVVAAGKDGNTVTAKDIMVTDVVTIGPQEDVSEALKKMRDRDVRQLPVIDAGNGGKLVGLLTLHDIVTIQPEVFAALSEKFAIEEQRRETGSAKLEGTCDRCGTFSEKLYERKDAFVCGQCAQQPDS